MAEAFREKMKQGKPLLGTLVTLPSPEVAEILAEAGFDWLFVDMEHGALDMRAVQHMVQTMEGRCPCLVRVPSGDEVWIKKVLDTGAQGIIFPHVNSADLAQELIRLCKYPPEGFRSVGIARAHRYGFAFQKYMENAKDVVIVIQVEHIEAVRNIESIVRVPGVDAVFIGPYDLSGSMGKIGQVTDPEVLEKIEKVRAVCMHAGLPLGIFGMDAEAVQPYIHQGYALIAVGLDALYLGRSAQQTLEEIQ